MLLTVIVSIFIIACIIAAIIAHLDHRRLAHLDRAQNIGPIPERIEPRPGDRRLLRDDRELEALGRS